MKVWRRWRRRESMRCLGRGACGRGRRKVDHAFIYQNASPSLFLLIFIPNNSIVGAASVILNPNCKPKIDDMTFYWLLVSKNIEAWFHKHRTTCKVDNLIVFEFLLELVLIINCWLRLLKLIEWIFKLIITIVIILIATTFFLIKLALT